MAKISVEYGKIKSDGGRNVMLRLVSGRTQKHIPIGVNLDKDDYKVYPDGRVRVTNDTKYFAIEDTLADLTRKMNAVLRENLGLTLSANDLYAVMTRKSGGDVRAMNFFAFAEDYLSKAEIKGKKNYFTMLNSLQRYNMGLRTLPFASVTFPFLQGYSLSLKDKPRAQSLYLGAMRHIYKQACLMFNDDDNTYLSPVLFDRFKVPKQKPRGQRALNVGTIREFFSFPVTTGREELAHDCCLLSFCLMGTNSIDLYEAETYRDGRLVYKRAKTRDRRNDSARIEIEVHDIIKPLFEKYRSVNGKHVFSFADKYANPQQFNRAINIGLKGIGKRMGVDGLQFYQFRHSLASIARNELHYAKSDIDEMLNHVGENRIADIYIKRDFSVINEINRRVIEFVFPK